jgi:hypothetical protein
MLLDGFSKKQHKHNKSVTQILHFDRYFAKKLNKWNSSYYFSRYYHSYFFFISKEPLLER